MEPAKPLRVFAASDYYGATLRTAVVAYIRSKGIDVEDYGEDKYYAAAERVAKSVADGRAATASPACETRGLLVCGTGTGVTIFANKIPTVYAVLCDSAEVAKNARSINNCNVLCMGQFQTSPEKGQEIVDAWLSTEFKAPCPASGNQPWNDEVSCFLSKSVEEMAGIGRSGSPQTSGAAA